MSHFVPMDSESVANELSMLIYQLSRPLHIRQPNETTTHYCSWLVHPLTGAVVLELPEEDTMPIHLEADEHILDELLQTHVDLSRIPQSAIALLNTAINANKGSSVVIYDFFPQYWKDRVLTYNDLIFTGWFD